MTTTNERWPTVPLLILAGAVGILAHRLRGMSTPTSPLPSTRPTPTSDSELTASMMTTMRQMMKEQAEETRRTLTAVLFPTYPTSTSPSGSQEPTDQSTLGFDYENSPLSEGIEAVLTREAEEDEHLRLMKERAVLEGRIRVLLEEESRRENQETSGPWQGVPRSPDDTPL